MGGWSRHRLAPPGHWNRIAQSVSAAAGLNVEENARLCALLNIAHADTGIASWEAKVYFDFWRPMLAIKTAATDGNPNTLEEAAWTPLIATPSFGGGHQRPQCLQHGCCHHPRRVLRNR